ncbi:putative MFS family arabinose efflux permease [Bradyrhizobium sp. LM3.2]
MENARAGRFAPTALMLGNLVTGCSVLAPAGMLPELAAGLDVSIHAAALLITFGAIILCIGSPLTAWLTSRIERRTLLTTTLAVLAFGNLASAFAPPTTRASLSPAWRCSRSARSTRRRPPARRH